MMDKTGFLKEFNEAFAKNDTDFILKSMSDDIVWDLVGHSKMFGKDAVEKALEEMQQIETLDLSIADILGHDNLAAAHGRMRIKEKGEIKTFGFSDFYEFVGTKDPLIKRMTSYVVPVKENSKN